MVHRAGGEEALGRASPAARDSPGPSSGCRPRGSRPARAIVYGTGVSGRRLRPAPARSPPRPSPRQPLEVGADLERAVLDLVAVAVSVHVLPERLQQLVLLDPVERHPVAGAQEERVVRGTRSCEPGGRRSGASGRRADSRRATRPGRSRSTDRPGRPRPRRSRCGSGCTWARPTMSRGSSGNMNGKPGEETHEAVPLLVADDRRVQLLAVRTARCT